MNQATITQGSEVFTLINVFTVEPEKQQDLVDLLIVATRDTMRHLPGFISASIHKSHDGKHVTNYAQWHSKEEFEAMRRDPAAMPHMQAAASIATEINPLSYEVAEVCVAGGTTVGEPI